MKLSDLKNGAVVELRSGQKYLKVDDTFLNLQNYGGFIPIQDYDENLLCTHPSLDEEKNLSIMDIVKVNNDVNSNTLYPNCCNQPLLKAYQNIWTWERPAEILTEDEKDYLRAVVTYFRDIKDIEWIAKQEVETSDYYILIALKDIDFCYLPTFPKVCDKFKGMEAGKHYSLKELSL